LNCYIAYSKIPELYEKGSTGGVATTLAYCALSEGFVDGILCSRNKGTFIAYNLEDLTLSCGSIYGAFPYQKLKGDKLGQIGKPCDIDEGYFFKIGLFCSHTSHSQEFKINRENRPKISRLYTPLKCWLCRDHVSTRADISVGDTQYDPKLNVIIVRTSIGQEILNYSSKKNMIRCNETTFSKIQKRQPYLWR